jgi:uncharacterized protein
MKVTRTDRGQLKVIKTGEGFLKAEVVFAVPCVLPYNENGIQKMEAKLPEEIFKQDTIESAKGAPVADGHPTQNGSRILVTPENYFQYIKGNLSEPKADGYGAKGLVTIYDKTLIDEIIAKKKTQVSIGFTCDIEDKPGMFNGQHYDAIQRNILINHLAITDDARAGDATHIMIDSKQEESKMADELKTDVKTGQVDASSAVDAGKADAADSSKAGEVKSFMYKTQDGSKDLKIDSKDIFDELIVLNKTIKELKGDEASKAKTLTAEDIQGMIEKAVKDALTPKADAKDDKKDAGADDKAKADEAEKKKKAEADAKEAETKETISLIRIVNRILPELKTDSMDLRQIKISIIEKGMPGKYRNDMTDEQINANCEAALEVLRVRANQFDGRIVVADEGTLKGQVEKNKIERTQMYGK